VAIGEAMRIRVEAANQSLSKEASVADDYPPERPVKCLIHNVE